MVAATTMPRFESIAVTGPVAVGDAPADKAGDGVVVAVTATTEAVEDERVTCRSCCCILPALWASPLPPTVAEDEAIEGSLSVAFSPTAGHEKAGWISLEEGGFGAGGREAAEEDEAEALRRMRGSPPSLLGTLIPLAALWGLEEGAPARGAAACLGEAEGAASCLASQTTRTWE
jgi:hypothetical protein